MPFKFQTIIPALLSTNMEAFKKKCFANTAEKLFTFDLAYCIVRL